MKIADNLKLILLTSTGLFPFLSGYAHGQSADGKYYEVKSIDENGIDLASLAHVEESDDITIGNGEFPAKLGLSRGKKLSTDVAIFAPDSYTNIEVDYRNRLGVVVGSVVRYFSGDKQSGYYPSDGAGGYVKKVTEKLSDNKNVEVYYYYSTAGDIIRFPIASPNRCGLEYETEGNVRCVKASKWTAPNGVYADFIYTIRSELLNRYNESDLTEISNSLGLKIEFDYRKISSPEKSAPAVYVLSSATASSKQKGECDKGASCSRKVSYDYSVAYSALLGFISTKIKSFTNVMGQTTYYARNTSANLSEANLQWETIRRPGHPDANVDDLRIDYGDLSTSSPAGRKSVTVKNASGDVWTYKREDWFTDDKRFLAGTKVTRTDPLNNNRVYMFDNDGNFAGYTDELLNTVKWEYSGHVKVKETRPNGGVTIWDNSGRVQIGSTNRETVETIKAVLSKPADDIVNKESYPHSLIAGNYCDNAKYCYKPLTTTDALKRVTEYGYDPTHGGIKTVIKPELESGKGRASDRYEYANISGAWVLDNVKSCQLLPGTGCGGTAGERVIKYTYGSNGLLAPVEQTVSAADGSVQSTVKRTYDAFGNIVSEDGPLPGDADTVRSFYDRAGKLVGAIGVDPDGTGTRHKAAIRYTYDDADRPTLIEKGIVDPKAVDLGSFAAKLATKIAYDVSGRKIRQTEFGDGVVSRVTQYKYDAVGNLTCVALRMDPGVGPEKFSNLPDSACVATTVADATRDPKPDHDRISKYSYDAAGRLTQITSGYGYEAASQVNELTVEYADNGRVWHLTDANGNVTTFEYDGFDRLQKTVYPGGSYEELQYDAAGNVKSKRTRAGQVISFTYDAWNRLTNKDIPNPAGGVISKKYAYDLFNNLIEAKEGESRKLGFVFDALGREKNQTDNVYPMGNISFEYDAAGRRTSFIWNDNVKTGYKYFYDGQISRIENESGVALASFDYDDLGRRIDINRANGVKTVFGYDSTSLLGSLDQNLSGSVGRLSVLFGRNVAGQIISRTSASDTYAWRGYNNTQRSYSINALNQVYSSSDGVFSPTTITYDDNGNLNSVKVDQTTTTYTYNADNQLVAANAPFAYDPLDRLYRGVFDSGRAGTVFLYDGSRLIAEVDQASGATLRRYVHGAGADEPLIWYEGAGVSDVRWLHSDERGSIIAITDGAGNSVATNSYNEYGLPGDRNVGRFQYTGQKWLSNLGLYDFKARMYSPSLGRFMQSDPIGFGDGPNLYSYVGSDPVNRTDPTGLSQCPLFTLCADYVGPRGPSGNDDNGGPAYGPGYGFNYGERYDFGGFDALWALRPRGATLTHAAAGLPASQQKAQLPPCTGGQVWAQALGNRAMQIGRKATQLGDKAVLAGGLVVAGSATTAVLSPAGVLIGGMIADAGAMVSVAGRLEMASGAILSVLGGRSIRSTGAQAITDWLPFSQHYKSSADRAVNSALDWAGVPDRPRCRKQ